MLVFRFIVLAIFILQKVHPLKTGYEEAVRQAQEKLQTLNLQTISQDLCVPLEGETPFIPWFGENRAIESGNVYEKVVWLHYLTSGGSGNMTGNLMAFRDLPSALFYEPKFGQRSERVIVKRFGAEPDKLLKAGLLLGGQKADYGDVAVTLPLLPKVPVTYILWNGDSEFPPDCKILFDSSAPRFLPTEDLVVLPSLGAYKLVETLKLI
jgi:hypothetical protein